MEDDNSEDQNEIISEKKIHTNIDYYAERISKLFRKGELQNSINRRIGSIIDSDIAFFKVFFDGFSGKESAKEIHADESLKNQICN